MIPYNKTAFGLNLVLRIHGSAVYRAILPSCFSVGIFLLLRYYYSQNGMREDLGHPYAIGALVASASFTCPPSPDLLHLASLIDLLDLLHLASSSFT